MIEHDQFQKELDRICRRLHHAYGSFVEYDDIMQTMYAWLYSDDGQKVAERWTSRPRKVAYEASWAARRMCALEKAVVVLRDPQDVLTYGTGVLRKLLPVAINGMEPYRSSGLSDEPKSKKDPAVAGDVLVMVWDVQKALTELAVPDREFLELCVGHDCEWGELAELLGVDRGVVRRRFERLVLQLKSILDGYEDDREYVGDRKVLSNAASQAAVRDE